MSPSAKKDVRVIRARSLRRAMTDAERKLWRHLRALPLEHGHFRRQATIGPYFADFACHERRLVIEVDGGGHAEPAKVESDNRRTGFLNSRDYRVLRFWNNEVLNSIDGVMDIILNAIAESALRPPPLTPPRHALRARVEGNAPPSYRRHKPFRESAHDPLHG